MNYVITNNLSLKYQRFTSSDCKEGFEHFDLWERLNSFLDITNIPYAFIALK